MVSVIGVLGMGTQSSDYLLLLLSYFSILTLLWPYAFSVMFQPYGVGLGYRGQSTERTWAAMPGAGLRRGGWRTIGVENTLREAQRKETES